MSQHYSSNALAFVGDAVLSLQVREYLWQQGIRNANKLQNLSTRYVSAMAQAEFVALLLEKESLSAEELLIYKRGRNTKSHSKAKNADIIAYRKSTGLEALWGYLYLTGQKERLEELWSLYQSFVEEK